MKQAIVEPLRPNPRNKERCNSYKRKELESQAYFIDGAHRPPESLRAVCYTGLFAACH